MCQLFKKRTATASLRHEHKPLVIFEICMYTIARMKQKLLEKTY